MQNQLNKLVKFNFCMRLLLNKEYWKAFLIVRSSQLLGIPEYQYAWWRSRFNLIKLGEL